ncbi:hypothetical protein PanWU01x14_328890, partial [Parasponia andersonii]
MSFENGPDEPIMRASYKRFQNPDLPTCLVYGLFPGPGHARPAHISHAEWGRP